MNIHEYQAKKLFRSFGIPVPVGGVARTSEEVVQQAAKLRAGTLVVKAQIHAGGRGKAGGVLTADGPEAARRHAERLLGNVLVTRQTGPEGRVVRSVLIEEGQNIEHEYYVAVTLDRATRRPVILVSPDGGMDIEEVAANTPGHLFKLGVDPLWGLRDYEARCLAAFLGFSGKRLHFCAGILQKLFTLYQSCDAALVEINPLILTTEGNLLALDAKLNLEENALFRHPDLKALEDPEERDPLEVQAERHGLNYIRLNGNIGVMVNGAGLAMATMDLIKQAGGEPANFLDVGGGADAGKILVKAVRGAVLGAKGAITGTVTEVSAADPVDISAAKARFREFEATLTNVTPDCRIVISTSEKRALLDNVVVTCTAITPATKPAAPGGVSFDAAAAADRLTLKWNAVPDATSYTVAYWKGSASAPESEYAYKTGIASTATSQELTNLESNTSYWAKVKAVGSLDSDWSETANATTMDSGGEPLLPTADLLDVVFRNDGSAMDNSSSATPVRRMPSSRP